MAGPSRDCQGPAKLANQPSLVRNNLHDVAANLLFQDTPSYDVQWGHNQTSVSLVAPPPQRLLAPELAAVSADLQVPARETSQGPEADLD